MTDTGPRTAKATQAVVRRGQETKAAALREVGWIVIPPEMLTHGTVARLDRVCEVEGFTREEAARMGHLAWPGRDRAGHTAMSEIEHPESSHGFASDPSAVVIPATPPDLLTWLRAQVDEDEADALAVEGDGHWDVPSTGVLELGGVADLDGLVTGPRMFAYHAARHDPARVLREVEAKRRILCEHRQVTFTDVSLGIKDAQVCYSCHGALIPEDTDDWDGDVSTVQVPFPCKTVRLLALPYADRPGYREEWRP